MQTPDPPSDTPGEVFLNPKDSYGGRFFKFQQPLPGPLKFTKDFPGNKHRGSKVGPTAIVIFMEALIPTCWGL